MRDPRIDFERIVICAEKVIEFAGALTFDEFIAEMLRYDATLRSLEIMGEVAKRVPCARLMGNVTRSNLNAVHRQTNR